MDCGGAWREVAAVIEGLYRRAVGLQSQAALAGDVRAFTLAGGVVDELLLLRGDLEQWSQGECFDPVEFHMKLRRLERQLATIEARLASRVQPGG